MTIYDKIRMYGISNCGLFFIYMTNPHVQISPWSLLYKMTIYDKIRMNFGISNQYVVSSLYRWNDWDLKTVRGLFFKNDHIWQNPHVFWYLKSVRGLFFIKWPYMTKSACILVSQISPWSLLYKMTIYDKIRMNFGISNQSVVSSL